MRPKSCFLNRHRVVTPLQCALNSGEKTDFHGVWSTAHEYLEPPSGGAVLIVEVSTPGSLISDWDLNPPFPPPHFKFRFAKRLGFRTCNPSQKLVPARFRGVLGTKLAGKAVQNTS